MTIGLSTTIPNLNYHQLFRSHIVNCNVCKKYDSASITFREDVSFGSGEGKGWEVNTKTKVNRRMCAVGVILFNKALKEDPTKSPWRPKSFPYVAKMYERVRFRPRGSLEWQLGNVIDRSLDQHGRPMGYEVEVTTMPKFEGAPPRKHHYYVNPNNIKPLVTYQEKQEALRQKQNPNQPPPQPRKTTSKSGKYTFTLGG